MRKVGRLVNVTDFLVGFLGGSILKVDLSGVVKKIRADSGFEFQVMIGGSLYVSGPCILQIYCVTISRIS